MELGNVHNAATLLPRLAANPFILLFAPWRVTDPIEVPGDIHEQIVDRGERTVAQGVQRNTTQIVPPGSAGMANHAGTGDTRTRIMFVHGVHDAGTAVLQR